MIYELQTHYLEDGESIELDEDSIVVDGSAHMSGTKVAVLEPADGDGDEQTDDTPRCGYEGCQRTVSDPTERCWQHEDEK